MAKFNQDVPQFGSAKPAQAGGSQHCVECEAMLTDALDGTLSAKEQAQFDLHMSGCPTCSQMLTDAQRGAAWLEMLRTPRPEPPTALLERILAQTGGQTSITEPRSLSILPSATAGSPMLANSVSLDGAGNVRLATVLPFRSRVASAFRAKSIGQTLLQPRLAMTAAMAFFSIGLTLNLTGVRLNELRASDLTPSNLQRSFYDAGTHVVRYYNNLRVVYELESRVRDLQRSNDNDVPPAPASDQKPADDSKPGSKPGQKQSLPRSGSGTSRRQGPTGPVSLLAAFHLADTPASPPWRLVCASPAVDTTSSTLQEGESV
ncbi:zf-HC2 domain-containing protein [Granulicella arctica]|uniref:Putative zinc-finger domain-containing protein n=1 Tax=Granulicella arctica TaxID=940613 RepID=A0A7Y9TR59_9BACT|nr:hypothetical protein [Granulicella arctica]